MAGYGAMIPALCLYYSGLGRVVVLDHQTNISPIRVVRGKKGNPSSNSGDYRLKTSLPDCRKSQGSRPKVGKYNRTLAVKIDVTPVVKTAAAWEANPGKWRTNLTVSSNLICNLRRCLETFQLSAQCFPTPDSRRVNVVVFFFFPARTHWLGVNVRLTMSHPNGRTARPRITRGKLQWFSSARDSFPTVTVIKCPPAPTEIGFSFGNNVTEIIYSKLWFWLQICKIR